MSDERPAIGVGQRVYTESGRELGTVRGFDEGGFYVSTREGIVSLSIEHERTGHEFGEGELMWRCSDCGEMGDLSDGMPEACPNCDAAREQIYYWIED
ncbi:DUF7130 family rubredoxin-like protein [Halobaculum gomorrense]|uniref:DUF7130 domain-containing protein n=1 Tax=Halobaculum gomorrense TaxID=43928 RepID=A0A1M5QCI2_9EURY|nr:hypothetical protein [Halobaculum gomorrense]SHH11620.1 hypothetical protein SAMN05443636_1837 [Halobaculum gomorrense]